MSFGITQLQTGITPPRLGNLMAYSYFCHEFPGCFAEMGVMFGGSLDLLASLHPDRKIYGIDGFEGLPEPGEHDLHKAGEFALKPNEYEFMKSHFRDKHSNVEILKGYSPEVFNEIPEDKVFSFVHVDVDLYDSVNDALDYFWPRLVDGGMMLFDDYGFDTTPGAKKAIDEWDHACMYRGELFFANYIFCGQYLIIK